MTDNVLQFTPRPRAKRPEPNTEIIKMLEEWLEHAKRGELQAAALSGVTYDHCTVSGIAYENHLTTLLGAVTLMQRRLTDKFE